jgi:hypothetical protein
MAEVAGVEDKLLATLRLEIEVSVIIFPWNCT